MNTRLRAFHYAVLCVMAVLLVGAAVPSMFLALLHGLLHAVERFVYEARDVVRGFRWSWRHAGWTQAEIDAEEYARIRAMFPPGSRIVVE